MSRYIETTIAPNTTANPRYGLEFGLMLSNELEVSILSAADRLPFWWWLLVSVGPPGDRVVPFYVLRNLVNTKALFDRCEARFLRSNPSAVPVQKYRAIAGGIWKNTRSTNS